MATELAPSITRNTASLGFVRPTRRTVFWRTFVPWQLVRFLIINLRISLMILKSHEPGAPSETRRVSRG